MVSSRSVRFDDLCPKQNETVMNQTEQNMEAESSIGYKNVFLVFLLQWRDVYIQAYENKHKILLEYVSQDL